MADLLTRLSNDERDYLRRLFIETATRDLPLANEYGVRLESPSVERDLLLRTLARLRSELVATDGRYCLRFRIDVVPCPYGGPAVLRLLPPTVTDQQGNERPARVRPVQGAVALSGPGGQMHDLRVLDISNSGMAVAAPFAQQAEPGSRLEDLELKLPGHQPFTVTGRVVRVGSDSARARMLALSFEEIDARAQAALRCFVFDNYGL